MGSVVMAMNSSSHFPASELEDKLDSYPGSVCGSPGAGWRQGWQGTSVEELPGAGGRGASDKHHLGTLRPRVSLRICPSCQNISGCAEVVCSYGENPIIAP